MIIFTLLLHMDFVYIDSLLTDYLVITPKYRVKILTGEVAFVTESIIRGHMRRNGIKGNQAGY